MEKGLIALAAALVLCVTAVATALSQGKTASHAMDAIARQPEAAGGIRTTAIIIAALIEGACLFAILVCLLGIIG